MPATTPFKPAIIAASLVDTLPVKLLSNAQQRHATTIKTNPNEAWPGSPGVHTSSTPPATMAHIPGRTRRSKFSRNRIHASSAVNTASRFSNSEAVAERAASCLRVARRASASAFAMQGRCAVSQWKVCKGRYRSSGLTSRALCVSAPGFVSMALVLRGRPSTERLMRRNGRTRRKPRSVNTHTRSVRCRAGSPSENW